MDLSSEIQWGIHNCSESFRSIIFQLSLADSVCYLWRARNSRII